MIAKNAKYIFSLISYKDAFLTSKMSFSRFQSLKQIILSYVRSSNQQLSSSLLITISDTSTFAESAISAMSILSIGTSVSTRQFWVWAHETEYLDVRSKLRWRCNYCIRVIAQIYAHKSTSHMRDHLKDVYKIFENEIMTISHKTFENCIKLIINFKIFRWLIIEGQWFTLHAFNEMKAESFHHFIKYLNKITTKIV